MLQFRNFSMLPRLFKKILQYNHGQYPRLTYLHRSISIALDQKASLYVHWPYCTKMCSYCNFNKYIRDTVDNRRMTDCLKKEAESLIRMSGVTEIQSIYFGGGTPSLAESSTVAAILDTVRNTVAMANDAEITLEANPTTTERIKLQQFRDAGVNRLSIGVQTFVEDDLKFLGRQHTAKEAIRCIGDAKDLFPGQVSIDVIFGRPGQTVNAWREELKQVMELCDDHISLYQLTVERGTPLQKWVDGGKVVLPDDEMMADLFEVAIKTLECNGFVQYEVSNFSRNGKYGRHNKAYWEGMNYIGIGPGAHGRFTPVKSGKHQREARVQILEPNRWMKEVEIHGHGTKLGKPQSQLELQEELVVMGLRTMNGICNETWSRRCDTHTLAEMFGNHDRIKNYVESRLLVLDDRGMRATKKGLAVLNPMIHDLLNILSDQRPNG